MHGAGVGFGVVGSVVGFGVVGGANVTRLLRRRRRRLQASTRNKSKAKIRRKNRASLFPVMVIRMKILKAVVVMSSKRKIFHGGKIKISNRIKQAADDCELSGFARH